MIHVVSRALGAALLAAALATAGTAVASPEAEPREPGRTDRTPTYRVAESGEAPGSPPPTLAPNRRSIFSEVVWRDGRLWLRGDVEAYAGRQVVVQKRRCETCRWRLHDVTRTGKRGWFRSGIRAPKHGSTFWRARVAASDGYVRSYSAVWETYF